jgi:anti-sigma28 factor (negative regulator of flagellin synthesis)
MIGEDASDRTRPRPTVSERTMDLQHLKSQIDRDEYAVDPHAVADAILAMLGRVDRPRPGSA